MRKIKIRKIDDKEITVKELKVKDIREILNIGETLGNDILKDIERLLPFAADIKPEDLGEMAPSEIKLLWEDFKEVNADFLAVVERLGIATAFGGLIRNHLTDALADLSKAGMQASGNTDGASS